MESLVLHADKVSKQLEGFIRKIITDAGFARAVVGLSGGIDSSLACYLTVDALGNKNVLGVRMPYRTSSRESLDHAQMVVNELGIRCETIPITEMVDPLINRFPKMDAIRKGNVMARARMIVLYDRSAEFKGLVVGTGNKTEELLGYTTLFGDSACALNPLGDLYKTQVRQLAEFWCLPDLIITKPPTADLWKGQTDEGELGFSYADVDQLLFLLVDKHLTPQQCIEAGHPEPFVKKVVKTIKQNAFKRTVAPIAYLEENYDFVNDPEWGK